MQRTLPVVVVVTASGLWAYTRWPSVRMRVRVSRRARTCVRLRGYALTSELCTLCTHAHRAVAWAKWSAPPPLIREWLATALYALIKRQYSICSLYEQGAICTVFISCIWVFHEYSTCTIGVLSIYSYLRHAHSVLHSLIDLNNEQDTIQYTSITIFLSLITELHIFRKVLPPPFHISLQIINLYLTECNIYAR